jgi:hypothetical protein
MKGIALNSKWRSRAFIVLAILIAPLVPALALPYLTPIVSGPGYPRYDLLGVAFFYVASLQFGAIFGIPLFLILRKFKLASVWSACVVGVCIGGGMAYFFGNTHSPAILFFSWAGSGGAAAVVFWLVSQSSSKNAQQAIPADRA